MLEFLSQGLVEYFKFLDARGVLYGAFIVGTLLALPLWTVAGYQDWRKQEVSGYVCLSIMVITGLYALLFAGWLHVLVVTVCAYFAFRTKEFKLIGQADFVLFAHWITVYINAYSGYGLYLLASIIFLACLLGYTLIYRDQEGRRWHRGMMVPIIPPYAVSVWVTAIVYIPLGPYLYLLGGTSL